MRLVFFCGLSLSSWLQQTTDPSNQLSSGDRAISQCRKNLFRRLIQTGGGVAVHVTSSIVSNAFAFETVGKDDQCVDASCLGVWDGILADCPHGRETIATCTSSQDDTPGVFSEPWDYSDIEKSDWREQMERLVTVLSLLSERRGESVLVQVREGRYLRVLFHEKGSNLGTATIGEFYFTPNDETVQFRIARSKSSTIFAQLLTGNMEIDRAEEIRKALGYAKLPILRNRRRSLFLIESDWDTFGPGSASLGPPSQLKTGEGRQVDDTQLPIDVIQLFPRKKTESLIH